MENVKAKGKRRGPQMNNLIKIRQEKQEKKKKERSWTAGPLLMRLSAGMRQTTEKGDGEGGFEWKLRLSGILNRMRS